MKRGKIIQVSDNYRLVSYPFGWEIQKFYPAKLIEHGKYKGQMSEERWELDSPAFPATLARGLELIVERIFAEDPDTTLTELPEALKKASMVLNDLKITAKHAAKKLENSDANR